MLVAAPAVAGMAAAFCFAPQAFASPVDNGGSSYSVAVTTGAYQVGAPLAELSSAVVLDRQVIRPATAKPKPKAKAKAKASQPTVWYTVRSGDSLSAIAGHVYRNSAAWPVLYWANKGQLPSPDVIQPGQRLRVPPMPATIPAAPSLPAAAPAAPATVTTTTPQPAAASAPVQAAPTSTVATGSGSSFQQCVIARESGGNSQVMNSSGHYGLYQFSEATWVAYGGSAADFGNASAAEQNQVFDNAMAAGGQSNWAPYDGC